MQITLFYPPLIAWAVLSLCLLLSPLQAQDLHITLLNGDCDGDNEVTLLDFGIVVSAFGSTPNDPNWDPRADLDGDLEVTLFDYGIVVRHFGAVGAEPFDPSAPRRPFPANGVRVRVRVDLRDWQGDPQLVLVEARRDAYEREHTEDFHFDPSSPYAVELWWVVGRNIPVVSVTQFDAEIYAQLWGEWTRYVIGSHDASDWSTYGRQSYWLYDWQ
ncbi:MAG: hypothetical protein KatS3mg022_0797 [Armatimonadota bacterium]|nr:MAG: hypothetical protein KatS3mg022_0797 [Armatimonadota bacterium]